MVKYRTKELKMLRMFQWNMELTWTDGTSFYFVISIVLKHFECEIAFSSMISQRNTAFMLKLSVRNEVKPGYLRLFEVIRGHPRKILTSNGYSPTISSRSGSQLMLIIFGRQFESLKDFHNHKNGIFRLSSGIFVLSKWNRWITHTVELQKSIQMISKLNLFPGKWKSKIHILTFGRRLGRSIGYTVARNAGPEWSGPVQGPDFFG